MIELRLLGSLDLRRSDAEPLSAVLAQPKRLALLVYLALAPGGSFRRRDTLAGLLWPEQDQEHARGSLRQAVRFLRRELGEAVVRNRGEEEIALDGDLLRCDAADLLRAAEDGRFEEAVALHRGELLGGFFVSEAAPEFEEWLEGTRRAVRAAAARAYWACVEDRQARGMGAEAIALARSALELEPDEEAGLRRLLQLLDAAGDRAGALAAYDGFARRLRARHDADPSAETQRAVAAIRQRSRPHHSEVATPEAGAPVAPGAGDHSEVRRPVRRGGWKTPGAVAAVLLGAVLVAFVIRRDLPADESHRTVAVVPTVDLTADSASSLAEAATDELISDLAQVSALRVINRRTMTRFRDPAEPLDSIARQVGAGLLVTSTLERRGAGVAFRTQVVVAGDPRAVWARTFSGSAGELPAWLQEVARGIADFARVRLTGSERAGLTSRRLVNAAGYEAYARGRWWWNKRGEAALFKGMEFFVQALDVEPTYALAQSGRADTYVQLGYGGFLPPEEAFGKAKEAARLALEFDSTLAEPHAALGFALMYYDWDWPAAEREFRRAIELSYSYATAHEWYGLFLAAMGRFPEAEREARIAQQLDPLSVAVTATRGWILHYAGKDREALEVLRSGVRSDSGNSIAQLYLGRVYQAMGRYDSASAHYLATGPLRTWIPTVAGQGTVAALEGRRAAARSVVHSLDSLARVGRYVTPYAVALVFAALGERDSAFARLEHGYRQRTHWMVWLNRDSRWATLRSDPRFADLVRRMGLPN